MGHLDGVAALRQVQSTPADTEANNEIHQSMRFFHSDDLSEILKTKRIIRRLQMRSECETPRNTVATALILVIFDGWFSAT